MSAHCHVTCHSLTVHIHLTALLYSNLLYSTVSFASSLATAYCFGFTSYLVTLSLLFNSFHCIFISSATTSHEASVVPFFTWTLAYNPFLLHQIPFTIHILTFRNLLLAFFAICCQLSQVMFCINLLHTLSFIFQHSNNHQNILIFTWTASSSLLLFLSFIRLCTITGACTESL